MGESTLRLMLFGCWRLDCDGRPVVVHAGVQRLVAYVALTGRRHRAHVAGILWPEHSEQHAQGNLRAMLWRLRHSGNVPPLLDVTTDSLALHEEVQVDVWELIASARALRDPEVPADGAAALLHSHGDLLPGWYDDWVIVERDRLRQLRLHALEVLAQRRSHEGRHADALEVAFLAVRTDPLRESAHRAVIQIHLEEGNVREAVRHYLEFRALLYRELRTEPTAQLRAIVGPLLSSQPAHGLADDRWVSSAESNSGESLGEAAPRPARHQSGAGTRERA